MEAAVDPYWCLSCGCRLEVDGYSQVYCSPQCHTAEKNSSPSIPRQSSSRQSSSYFADFDDFEAEVCHIEDCSYSDNLPVPTRNTWIGRGNAGILAWAQSVPAGAPSDDEPSGPTKPKLLNGVCAPSKPSLYMSRAQPARPVPSRPILTPQQSLPQLSRGSPSLKSTSLVSFTTASSYTLATPATGSVVGSLAAYDTRQPGVKGLIGGLKAHLSHLTTPAAPQKEKRSSTVTRRDTDTDLSRAQKTRRAQSPVAFYHMPEEYAPKRRDAAARTVTKEKSQPASTNKYTSTTAVDDHPAYRARGRKTSRYPS
ncbi:hypothetical protein C8Q73DRAFT_655178 [Cubamyces lactineus]|nr:hypothetical protein C8Q73DRAFT_655178 [Cubamyces lactineus]